MFSIVCDPDTLGLNKSMTATAAMASPFHCQLFSLLQIIPKVTGRLVYKPDSFPETQPTLTVNSRYRLPLYRMSTNDQVASY